MSHTIDSTNAGHGVPFGVLGVSLTDSVERRTTSVDLMEGQCAPGTIRIYKNLPQHSDLFSSNERDSLEDLDLQPYRQAHLRVADR